MKRKLPVVECDLCRQQQVDNGDVTEILGLTIKASFYAGHAGDGSLPKDLFICDGCVQGTADHGPYRMVVLAEDVFGRLEELDLPNYFTPQGTE